MTLVTRVNEELHANAGTQERTISLAQQLQEGFAPTSLVDDRRGKVKGAHPRQDDVAGAGQFVWRGHAPRLPAQLRDHLGHSRKIADSEICNPDHHPVTIDCNRRDQDCDDESEGGER